MLSFVKTKQMKQKRLHLLAVAHHLFTPQHELAFHPLSPDDPDRDHPWPPSGQGQWILLSLYLTRSPPSALFQRSQRESRPLSLNPSLSLILESSLLCLSSCLPSFLGTSFSAGPLHIMDCKVLTRAHCPSPSSHISILKSVIQQRALFKSMS